jgi:hypothetical protein
MANWSIENMERQAVDGLVTKITWTVTVIIGMEFANRNGIVEMQRSNTFIPFDQLTEEKILEWAWEKIDKATIESELSEIAQKKVDARTNNSMLNGLPW